MSDKDPERFRLALRQMALDAALDQDDELDTQGYEPLAQDVEDRLVDLADRTPSESAPAPIAGQAAPHAVPRVQAGRFTQRRFLHYIRSRPVLITVGASLGVAAAAAAVWFVGKPPVIHRPAYVAIAPPAIPLPGPEGKLMLGGGATSGVPVSSLRLRRNQSLSLILRPQKSVSEASEVYSFIRHKNGPPRPWVIPQKADGGAFVLNIPLHEAPGLEAEQELMFVFGPAGPPPDPLRIGKDDHLDSYSLVTVQLVVTD